MERNGHRSAEHRKKAKTRASAIRTDGEVRPTLDLFILNDKRVEFGIICKRATERQKSEDTHTPQSPQTNEKALPKKGSAFLVTAAS